MDFVGVLPDEPRLYLLPVARVEYEPAATADLRKLGAGTRGLLKRLIKDSLLEPEDKTVFTALHGSEDYLVFHTGRMLVVFSQSGNVRVVERVLKQHEFANPWVLATLVPPRPAARRLSF